MPTIHASTTLTFSYFHKPGTDYYIYICDNVPDVSPDSTITVTLNDSTKQSSIIHLDDTVSLDIQNILEIKHSMYHSPTRQLYIVTKEDMDTLDGSIKIYNSYTNTSMIFPLLYSKSIDDGS
tara:strand:+ start:3155 stop:3520 length:366 start_codon:yes stop_codon:yes gene_type:complete